MKKKNQQLKSFMVFERRTCKRSLNAEETLETIIRNELRTSEFQGKLQKLKKANN